MTQATQTSIVDDLERRLDLLIEAWAKWRDEQLDDEHRYLVDGAFSSQVQVLEYLLQQLGCDVIPF